MIEATRREFLQSSGLAAVGATISSGSVRASPTAAQWESSSFDIHKTFEKFMRDIGGTPADSGGAVTFVGADPIVRSHFRIGACMAIPAMAMRRALRRSGATARGRPRISKSICASPFTTCFLM